MDRSSARVSRDLEWHRSRNRRRATAPPGSGLAWLPTRARMAHGWHAMRVTRSDVGERIAAAERGRPARPPARCAPALLAALVLAAATGCAPRVAATASAPPPPAKRLFEPYPPERVAGVRNPHDYEGKPLCQRCHVPTGEIVTNDPVALCSGCHAFDTHHNSRHSHPVNVVQKTAVDLPLRPGGKVACHTCHDPHRAKGSLRKPFNDLCVGCHQGH